MLPRHRRFFAVAAVLLLVTPPLVGIVRPGSPQLILKEGRMLAPSSSATSRPVAVTQIAEGSLFLAFKNR